MIDWTPPVVADCGKRGFLAVSDILVDGELMPLKQPVHRHGHHGVGGYGETPGVAVANMERAKGSVERLFA